MALLLVKFKSLEMSFSVHDRPFYFSPSSSHSYTLTIDVSFLFSRLLDMLESSSSSNPSSFFELVASSTISHFSLHYTFHSRTLNLEPSFLFAHEPSLR